VGLFVSPGKVRLHLAVLWWRCNAVKATHEACGLLQLHSILLQWSRSLQLLRAVWQGLAHLSSSVSCMVCAGVLLCRMCSCSSYVLHCSLLQWPDLVCLCALLMRAAAGTMICWALQLLSVLLGLVDSAVLRGEVHTPVWVMG